MGRHFHPMDEHDHRDGKAVRKIISQRLKEFYADLRETLDPNTEEFFDRVMRQQRNQAGTGQPRSAR